MSAPYPIDAPPENKSKPYRVTAYRSYGIIRYKCITVGDYKYYWQANAVSWFYYHVLGFNCNTWKNND